MEKNNKKNGNNNLTILALSIGATGTKAGVLKLRDNDIEILRHKQYKPQGQDRDSIISLAWRAALEVLEENGIPRDSIDGIGIITAGAVDTINKIVLNPPYVRWSNVNLQEVFRDMLNGSKTLFIDNDANAAILAEQRFGLGKDISDFICVLSCTGVGGGIVLNGEIYRGHGGIAGEIGHQVVEARGTRYCGCGNKGCLEAYGSGRAIEREMKDVIHAGQNTTLAAIGDTLTYSDICRAADENDRYAIEALQKMGTYLGIGIANLVNILSPEKVILSGSLLKGLKHFRKQMEEEIGNRAFPKARAAMTLEFTKFNDNWDMYAVAATFLYQWEKKRP